MEFSFCNKYIVSLSPKKIKKDKLEEVYDTGNRLIEALKIKDLHNRPTGVDWWC